MRSSKVSTPPTPASGTSATAGPGLTGSSNGIGRSASRKVLAGLGRTESLRSTASSADGIGHLGTGGGTHVTSSPLPPTTGGGLSEASVQMRRQLDELRRMQLELALKHVEVGATALSLSTEELDPNERGDDPDGENEDSEDAHGRNARLRQDNINRKEKEVHSLMSSLQALGDQM
ncbi:hypothetical protein BC830DRAFT_1135161 [Chytriomyces sp. MP71]|nr:hypothetical protein BC830DRAFT_1135161 [Chytriomyces sp. MP71]